MSAPATTPAARTASQTVHRTPTVSVVEPHSAVETELLVVPCFEQDDLADARLVRDGTSGEVERAWARSELTGKLYEIFLTVLTVEGRTTRTALVGAGPRQDFSSERLRRIATTAGLIARHRRLTSVRLLYRDGLSLAPADAAQAMAEGLVMANFEGGAHKTGNPCVMLDRAEIAIGPEVATAAAVQRGVVLGECTNMARELANEPGNLLTPRMFADRAAAMATAAGLSVDVLDEHRIAELNMGMLLGVARGSQEPPRLLVLRYEPAGAPTDITLGLIGKGITFDTGGISIKPAENMDKMKDDMAGGAAVVCAMAAISRLKAPVRCVAVVPMTENMPGGKAIKPGDILTSAAGKTVEILNTDAEGRLVLGDGLWYARQLGATHLVDVATLTGAVVVALGKSTSGLFGTPAWWVDAVQRASERAGDRSWPMPVFDDYREQLKSEIADFTNTGGRAAGAITGALFIKEFAGDLPWVHIDIAGTAWAEEAKPYQPKGATGVAVRTLAELALGAESWSKLKKDR